MCHSILDKLPKYLTKESNGRYKSFVRKEFLGIRRRLRHQVVMKRWPDRLVWPEARKPDKKDVTRWIGWVKPHMDVWLEWRKVNYPTPEELEKWDNYGTPAGDKISAAEIEFSPDTEWNGEEFYERDDGDKSQGSDSDA